VLRIIMRCLAFLLLVFMFAPSGFAKSPARKAENDAKSDAGAATSSASVVGNNAAEATTLADTSASEHAVPAQKVATDSKAASDNSRPAPRFIPMVTTTGTLGLFTVETADTIPKGGFGYSAFGNKFGRMPGSVTIFQLGFDVGYGVADRLNVYASFVPYGHVHVGCRQQLSLSPANALNPLYGGTIFHTVLTVPTPPCTGSFFTFLGTPGFVEDYPFAANNSGGVGDVTLGLKYAILSQRLGDPVSLSVRNDVVIGTKTRLDDLIANGTQGSPLSDLISIALSKQWSNVVTGTFNFGYMYTRDVRDFNGNNAFRMADQLKVSAGLLFFPEKRIQVMSEYTGIVFTESFTDTVFGARDPVDNVAGVRIYPWKWLAFDLGYRYMQNLRDLNDRHGFVIKLGTAWWPEKGPPVNHPPTISCTADKSSVYLDSGDMVAITCSASDPDNDPLTYTWSSTCGKVDGDGPQVRWLSAGVPVGTCVITAKVDDGRGGAASSSVNVRVEPKPNRPPTITCSADRTSVFAGERVHITTNASDPDGDPLTYTWRTNGGQIVGSGAAVDLDTTNLAPGSYTVTVRVDDGRGGAADCSSTIEVKAVPPPPQASKISDCAFGKPLSTRIDNVCKRILDDVALRLQNEPRATAVIIGYSDTTERTPEKIAGDRATNAVKYLGEKGIDPSRTSTRTGAGQAGATDNRRIDVIWVPEGASY
jgi:outer membrane protein OmpA-like peptidoglycan-associated protein